MSEERQSLQPGQGIEQSSKRLLLWVAIPILFAGAYYAGWYHRNHKYDAFAQCLAAKQARMYGLYWCSHCADQKKEFGASFQYVPYVECAIKGSKELAPECKGAGIKLFPSWQFGTEPPKEGVLPLEALSQKTGCRLP